MTEKAFLYVAVEIVSLGYLTNRPNRQTDKQTKVYWQ